jgi:TP901 family phage tail tape measure protein
MSTIGFLSIGMGVNSSGLTTGFRTAADKVKGFAAELNPLAGLGLAAGAALGLKAAVDQALTAEKAMLGLSKATDLSGAGLAGMKGELDALATSVGGVPVGQIYEIATAGAKAGIAQGDLVGFTKGVIDASAAMDDIPASQIAEQMGKISAVFRLSIGDMTGLESVFDKLGDSGTNAADENMALTQRVSGTAAAAGVAAQEVAALGAALLDTGTQVELGATTIQRLLMALNSVKGQAGFAQAMGISVEEFAAKVKASPIAALQEFLVALKGMDAQAQQTAIKAIGVDGIQAAGEVQKLSQQTDTLAKYLGMANEQMQTHDQILKSAKAEQESTGAALERVGNAFRIAGAAVGTAFLPAIKGAAEMMTSVAPVISGAVQGIGAVINVVFRGARIMVNGFIAGMVTGLSNLIKAVGSAGGLIPNQLAGMTDGLDAFAQELQSAAMDDVNAMTGAAATMDGAMGAAGGAVDGVTSSLQAGAPAAAALGGSFKAAADDAQKLKDDVASLESSLREQVATFGMEGAAADIAKLKLQGATDEQLAGAVALSQQLEARKAAAKEQEDLTRQQQQQDEDLARQAQQVHEEVMTPREKLDAAMGKLQTLKDRGLVSEEDFARKKLANEQEFARAGEADTGGAGAGEVKFAGAAELGSKEAFSTLAQFRAGKGPGGDGLKDVAATNRKQVEQNDRQIDLLAQLGTKLGDAVGAAVVNF